MKPLEILLWLEVLLTIIITALTGVEIMNYQGYRHKIELENMEWQEQHANMFFSIGNHSETHSEVTITITINGLTSRIEKIRKTDVHFRSYHYAYLPEGTHTIRVECDVPGIEPEELTVILPDWKYLYLSLCDDLHSRKPVLSVILRDHPILII